MKLRDWLRARELNARRIASGKSGADRAGWLEDADYFKRAAEAVDEIARLKAAACVPVLVAVNPSRDQGPCTVCGVPWAKHGTAPTCASHDYTPGVKGTPK